MLFWLDSNVSERTAVFCPKLEYTAEIVNDCRLESRSTTPKNVVDVTQLELQLSDHPPASKTGLDPIYLVWHQA